MNGQTLEMNDSYQLVRWTLFDGTVTAYQYDPNGNLTEIREGTSVTRFEYDSLNRLVAVVTPDGQRLTYTYKLGERSLIEQHQHGSILVEDLRDTGLTFSGPLQVTATRPLAGVLGSVRFSENLGTFQLSNADGSEISRPQENIEASLKKLFLFDSSIPPKGLQSGFNIPFNTMFMPGEYLTINCCPECFISEGHPDCPPCLPPPPPPEPPQVPTSLSIVPGTDSTTTESSCTTGGLAGCGVTRTFTYQVNDQNGLPITVVNMPVGDVICNTSTNQLNLQSYTTTCGGTTGSCSGTAGPCGKFTDANGQFPEQLTVCAPACKPSGTCTTAGQTIAKQTWTIDGKQLTSDVKSISYQCNKILVNGQ